MTADANAAIAGACSAGATDILVVDAHDGMLNLIWEDLDPRAELIRGYENRDGAINVKGRGLPASVGRGMPATPKVSEPLATSDQW